MKKPELLVPAGTFEKMKYAFAYGADAVYAGIPRFSLRARENDFTLQRVIDAVEYAHQHNKRVYLTMNIFPHNNKIDSFVGMLERVASLNPDGLIMADPGMILVARERFPDLPVHLSTQANTVNWQSVRFWKQIGVKRIILSRELRLDEIEEIRRHVPDIELETFVHGAICIAYSGRCLLSNYFTHRDANQGTCTNACRWEYKLYSEPAEMESERDIHLPLKNNYYLEEAERPGQLMPVDEDEHGTYIMNAKDLSTIHILDKIVKAGLDSLKIEGRTKSVYYVSVITRAYRKALDLVLQNKPVSPELIAEVYTVANRGYVTGFLERNPLEKGQNYESGHSSVQNRIFCGIVKDWDENRGLATVAVRNRFEIGDELELVSPQKTIRFSTEEMLDLSGEAIRVAHGGGKDIRLPLPEKPEPFALLRKVVKETQPVSI
ncbi:MAG: tRNA 5-hydroxyuridine modification protein YegQ [Calditrichaeota bacterium]|nr:tRNA 5-hydroxyuridine modification protein YegQ [Calditrichota bacterium]